jgi:hypothetical protein
MVCGQRKYFLCDLRDFGVSPLNFSRLFACFAGSISDISGVLVSLYRPLRQELELCHTKRLIPFLGEQYA